MAKEEDEARFTVVAKKEDEAVSAAVAKKADMARRATMAKKTVGTLSRCSLPFLSFAFTCVFFLPFIVPGAIVHGIVFARVA